jgi:hypothetical protein
LLAVEPEQPEALADPIPPEPGRPGDPFDELQNYLLETVATVLVEEARLPRSKACRFTANILVCCFGKSPRRVGVSLEDVVENLAESLERQWRKLRENAPMQTQSERVLPQTEGPGEQN